MAYVCVCVFMGVCVCVKEKELGKRLGSLHVAVLAKQETNRGLTRSKV